MTTDTKPLNETGGPKPKSWTRYMPHIARAIFGLVFFVFGLNGFFHFIPEPSTPMPERALHSLPA